MNKPIIPTSAVSVELTNAFADKIAEFYPPKTPFDVEKNLRIARAILRLPALRDALPATRDWQPIETAPLDGREVLLRVKYRAGIPGGKLVGHFMQGGHCIEDHPAIARGWYFWSGRMFDEAAEPTHWMELPTDDPTAGSDA
jgi:hypothetical protein